MNSIAIIHLITALAMIGISLPLVKRKIKRNQWYGVRIPEAFKSEERWFEINEYGGRLMLRLGIIMTIGSGIGLILPEKYWILYAFGALAIVLVGLGVTLAFIFRYAEKTKKADGRELYN